ncbi:MAG: ferritin-like domain-containing protein [Chloroflexi bacterium]|nr:ferritin-like domain-containing protein [Chloroflexota bacterium]
MTKEKLIEGLNHDLAAEYRAIFQYLQQSFLLKGLGRIPFSEYLSKEAQGEMRHVEFLAEKIVSLGGMPTITPLPVKVGKDLREMLQNDLEAEREAIADYKERAKQAEEFGDIGLQVELENLLAEETHHLEELQKLLEG